MVIPFMHFWATCVACDCSVLHLDRFVQKSFEIVETKLKTFAKHQLKLSAQSSSKFTHCRTLSTIIPCMPYITNSNAFDERHRQSVLLFIDLTLAAPWINKWCLFRQSISGELFIWVTANEINFAPFPRVFKNESFTETIGKRSSFHFFLHKASHPDSI